MNASDSEHRDRTMASPIIARMSTIGTEARPPMICWGRNVWTRAAIAALVQTFLPQQIIGGLASVPIVDILAMMGLAIVLSLCSESDAFIGASFGQMGFG